MNSSAAKMQGAWYEAAPGKGIVYDLSSAALSAPDTVSRLRAVVGLGKSGDPRAVRPLMDLVADRDPAIRRGAIAALGELKSGRAVEVLIGRLQDRGEEMEIRKRAAETLAAIRSTGALRELKSFSANADEDPALRVHVAVLISHDGTV